MRPHSAPRSSLAGGVLALLAACPATEPRAQDFAPGEKLALFHCGRCHVINERNRMGGIGSTPAFKTMRGHPEFEAKMRSFYALRPHPAFTQIPGVTEPFTPELPSPIHPVELTEEELDRIVDYALTLEAADLGGQLRSR
ncbi:hypothetical protein H0I76_01020 [Limibaculum sp. M0105]|uniref:Cytochrome c domain-containing protein n=1 Tax=Thermohalobaculum xanthum TaxID=2753746 RepID=A0A8J7SE95_9RHOB|nr:hypothetical protein [Thermohalobaculum xanthum]MBK0397760.1 hypothetical protein [Thermohalobaculum xanthum]